jgi:hypothetical protein
MEDGSIADVVFKLKTYCLTIGMARPTKWVVTIPSTPLPSPWMMDAHRLLSITLPVRLGSSSREEA